MKNKRIIDYVMQSPNNTNPAVLESMLEAISGGADTGIVGYYYDGSKEYEYIEVDGILLAKISNVPLNGTDYNKAMMIFQEPDLNYYRGYDLTVEAIPAEHENNYFGCDVVAASGLMIVMSIAGNITEEGMVVGKGVWASATNLDGNRIDGIVYYTFHKE